MKNLKVSAKMLVGFAIVIAFSVITGAVGIYGMLRLNTAQSDLYDDNLMAIEAMGNLRELFGNERNEFRNIFINGYFLNDSNFDLNAAIAKFDGYKTTADENFEQYEATIDPDADENAYYTARDIWHGIYADMKTQIFPLMRAGQWEDAFALFNASAPNVITPLVNGFAESSANNDLWAQEADAAGGVLYNTMAIVLSVVLVVSIAVSFILAFYISKLISTPLLFIKNILYEMGARGRVDFTEDEYRAAEALAESKDEAGQSIRMLINTGRRLEKVGNSLKRIAGGDLTEDITLLSDADTIGNSMVTMLNSLNSMFGEINSSTEQVSTGSKQVAEGSQSLAQGSTEQAAAVEELSSSIAEIANKTKVNSDMADKAARLADTIKNNAEKGSEQMGDMIAAVQEINQASHNISNVIKVIDDIAFQTNILALNAAVEAARAGEAGKGFAVVAEEVRNLAAKSAEAAKNTSSLIANSMQKAEVGTSIANMTAESLKEIVEGINESAKIVTDIAESSREQSGAITQINQGVEQVAQVVQQNSATAEQSAAASEEMNGQSEMLKGLVAQFTIK